MESILKVVVALTIKLARIMIPWNLFVVMGDSYIPDIVVRSNRSANSGFRNLKECDRMSVSISRDARQSKHACLKDRAHRSQLCHGVVLG